MKQGPVVLLLGAALVAGAALASEPASTAKAATPAVHSAAKLSIAKGEITALDAAKKTVTVKGSAASWTFETASSTHFLAAHKAAAWGDLKVGAKVSVSFHQKGDQKIADKINVEG